MDMNRQKLERKSIVRASVIIIIGCSYYHELVDVVVDDAA
jgi:hypothetical protein